MGGEPESLDFGAAESWPLVVAADHGEARRGDTLKSNLLHL